MTTFARGPVRASVPATSANLGPGFDSLGLALTLRDELVVEAVGRGLVVEVEGAGADDVPRDRTHLVVRAIHAGFDAMQVVPPGLRLRCRNEIPHARGLGSSSAAIVAGLGLARALVQDGHLALDDHAVFRLAARIEGHPDNVAPALHGGLVISGTDEEGPFAVPAPVDPRISAVVFVPPGGVSTEVARRLLPDQVSHRDAAAGAARAALLVAALAGHPEQLLRATHDVLHQPYRRPAMPDSLDLVEALRADGVPAVVSGAGPTVLAFTTVDDAGPELTDFRPSGWTSHHLGVDHDGLLLD